MDSEQGVGRLLTAEDVATKLQISKSFAYQLMKSGEIRMVKIGKCSRVTEPDLAEYIEKCKLNG
ncbi:MAG: hypothetical protein C3F13_04540 [Anaerolineales bacterium]|nr:MAG: hypothetical protein C3F13_04540 [Anaerolineales bacterium]